MLAVEVPPMAPPSGAAVPWGKLCYFLLGLNCCVLLGLDLRIKMYWVFISLLFVPLFM